MTTPRGMLDQNANAIIEKLIERVTAGDLTALRLCVERIIPRAKPDNGINFELPDGRTDSDDNMFQIANNITEAVAAALLGGVDNIPATFINFQKHLYEHRSTP